MNTCNHFVAVFAIAASTHLALARTRDLTVSEARELIKTYLGQAVSKLPHFGLEDFKRGTPPEFYAFEGTATPPVHDGSPVIGSFAVDRATGRVRRLVACEEVHSPALSLMQRTLRKKIDLTPRDAEGLAGRAPCAP